MSQSPDSIPAKTAGPSIDLDALMKEAQKDLEFDMTNAENVSVKVPFLMEKYARKLLFSKAALKKTEMDMDEIYSDRMDHYTTSHNVRIDRRDMDVYIKGDKQYNQARAKHETRKLEVEYIQAIIKALEGLSFNVNNAVKLYIWKQGGR